MIKFGPKYTKLKTDLQLACCRMKVLQAIKSEQSVKLRKEIADYLTNGKYATAKVKVQSVLRHEASVEAMELIEMFCEQLLERYGLFKDTKKLDFSLVQAVTSLIWVTPYIQSEISEMKNIAKQLSMKYGNNFTRAALKNKQNNVNTDLIQRIKLLNSPEVEVFQCLQDIIEKYQISKEIKEGMENYFMNVNDCKRKSTKYKIMFEDKSKKSFTTNDNHTKQELTKCDEMHSHKFSQIHGNKDKLKINSSFSSPKVDITGESLHTSVNQNDCDTCKNALHSKLKSDLDALSLNSDKYDVKKCEEYVSETTFEKLYPVSEQCCYCCGLNTSDSFYTAESNSNDSLSFIDSNKMYKDNGGLQAKIFEEPPPSYDAVVHLTEREFTNISTETEKEGENITETVYHMPPSCPSQSLVDEEE